MIWENFYNIKATTKKIHVCNIKVMDGIKDAYKRHLWMHM